MNVRTIGRFAVVAAVAIGVAAPVAAQDESGDALVYLGCMSAVNALTMHAFELTTDAVEFPNVGNAAWEADMMRATGVLSAPAAVIGECDPPAMFAEAHGHYVDATDDLEDAGDAFAHGLLTGNVASIESGAASVQSAVANLQLAIDAMPDAGAAPAIGEGTF